MPKRRIPAVSPAEFVAARHLRGGKPPTWSLQDLRDSLYSLHVIQRYTLSDIGLMFGVSGERVRQWVATCGVRRPDRPFTVYARRWDEASSRFVPYDRLAEEQHAEKEAARVKRLDSQKEGVRRRNEMLRIVRVLRRKLGRKPLNREICEELGIPYTVPSAPIVLGIYWVYSLVPPVPPHIGYTQFIQAARLTGRRHSHKPLDKTQGTP